MSYRKDMSDMNNTPRAERLHIGIFGRRNAGKSSILNAITGQNAAVVSPAPGTTTDPVYKAMELPPLGPVMFIDTPGIDDEGELGELRIQKTKEIIRKTDIAVIVVDGEKGLGEYEKELSRTFGEAGVKFLVVYNKADVSYVRTRSGIRLSTVTGENLDKLKSEIIALGLIVKGETPQRLAGDLLEAGDLVVLVIPIDEAAPKGRLILPQQQVIRDILDAGAVPVLAGVQGLGGTLAKLKDAPRLVITDSQVFGQVAELVPCEIPLTSFSILMARYKGVLDEAVRGVRFIDTLIDGDKILIAEGCTHHRQCEDIGTVKIPRMLGEHTGFKFNYTFSSGGGFPEELSGFKLIIHCGGCMQNPREMRFRHQAAKDAGVPVTNYGIIISHMQGILERCIRPFKGNNIFNSSPVKKGHSEK
ncbi:MAG: [FeFe] hydrogenase H-cluster maturation GTPase HydF [Oscillospiraceae bacterium]|nr:[FeFe] hydrogenase H-cluster maturation GTPase HydF [Oscillospiraceae bacterium]